MRDEDKPGVGEVEKLLDEALSRPSGERTGWLAERCPDEDLRQEVISLLDALESSQDFLEPAPPEGEPGEVVPPPGEIGSFRLLRSLGTGGSSQVWLAVRHDGAYERQVAVKIPHRSADSELLRRFMAERRILASLDHPHIAALYDSGTTDDGRPYFVMEYVAGTPIDTWCDRRRISIDGRVELFRKVCSAVHYAHQHLVVHRDIKPGNVLVTDDGEPKLVDFGIAKMLDPARRGETTRRGLVPLTLAYASPEQVAGDDIATPSDVYSLGLLLYSLLCGRLPPRSWTGEQSGEPLPPPSELVTDTAPGENEDVAMPSAAARAAARNSEPERLRRRLRGDLDRIISKAVHPEPARRYASADQLAEDLRRERAGLPILARGDSWTYRARRWVTRNRLAAGLAALLLVTLLTFSATMTIQAHRLTAARDQARAQLDRATNTTELVIDLFEMSDPGQARGDTVSARQLLDQGVLKVESRFAHLPGQRAVLLHTLGTLYHKLGLYREGRRLLEQAVELQRVSGAPSQALAESLTRLGELADDQGDTRRSVQVLEEALQLILKTHGENHPEVVEVRTRLAAAHLHGGNFASAEMLLTRILASPELADSHPELHAEALYQHGQLQMEQGRADLAEPLIREALSHWRASHGPDHPAVGDALNKLGMALAFQGHHRSAVEAYEEALQVRRRVLADDHPDTLRTMHNMAGSQIALGRVEAAEDALETVLVAHRRIYGEDSVEVAKVHSVAARAAQRRGDLELAEDRLEQALEVGRRAMTPGDPGIAFALVNLGRLRMQMGQPERAVGPLREALEVRRGALPKDNPLVVEAEAALARCLEELGGEGQAGGRASTRSASPTST